MSWSEAPGNMSTLMLLLAGGTGAAVAAAIERLVKIAIELQMEKRRELAARRKFVLDATVALVTGKQNTGNDYHAGEVSALFTRLTYLMENDGSAWEKAKYHAEAHGQNSDELRKRASAKDLLPP